MTQALLNGPEYQPLPRHATDDAILNFEDQIVARVPRLGESGGQHQSDPAASFAGRSVLREFVPDESLLADVGGRVSPDAPQNQNGYTPRHLDPVADDPMAKYSRRIGLVSASSSDPMAGYRSSMDGVVGRFSNDYQTYPGERRDFRPGIEVCYSSRSYSTA